MPPIRHKYLKMRVARATPTCNDHQTFIDVRTLVTSLLRFFPVWHRFLDSQPCLPLRDFTRLANTLRISTNWSWGGIKTFWAKAN